MSVEIWIILVLVVVTALGFDFTNGFHDTGNAMATSIATGALKPKTAVALSAVLNLVGAFLSVQVAATITKSVLTLQSSDGNLLPGVNETDALNIIFAGLIGAILWNLATWLFGLPSSSSHALFGGLVGAGIAALGMSGVNWGGVWAKIIMPSLFAPVIAAIVAMVSTFIIFKIIVGAVARKLDNGFKYGQVATASLVSLAHGTGDAQKTMGVIALALIVTGNLTAEKVSHGLPFWVVFSCAFAIAMGTYLGGWRIIRALGKGLIDISPAQGMSAQGAASAIILTSSAAGMALSTTHVATGSIIGSGLGKKGGVVRWSVAGRMVLAWVVTLPAAAVVGAICFWIADLLGGVAGAITIFAILVAGSAYMFIQSNRQKVDASNVNDDWEAGEEPIELGIDQPTAPAADGATLTIDTTSALDGATGIIDTRPAADPEPTRKH